MKGKESCHGACKDGEASMLHYTDHSFLGLKLFQVLHSSTFSTCILSHVIIFDIDASDGIKIPHILRYFKAFVGLKSLHMS